jgi:hypothetical protein
VKPNSQRENQRAYWNFTQRLANIRRSCRSERIRAASKWEIPVDISFHVRGKDLKPAGGTALAAFVEWSDATGQHVRRQEPAAEKTFTGTFGWMKVPCQAKVPAGVRRMKLFLGARPTTGTLLLDDITIKVRL